MTAATTAGKERRGGRVLVIDNYDSFTYNLVQYLLELGAGTTVFRNDAIDVAGIEELEPSRIVISPGPGVPEDAGVTMDCIRTFAGRVPILGVCLGHQAIGAVFGGRVVGAPELVHGKASEVHHVGTGIYAGLPDPFTAGRYHSLVLERASLPGCLAVTAQTADGTVMGVRHRELWVEGVQFHPESILTPCGKDLLRNFLRLTLGGAVLTGAMEEWA